MSVWLYKNIKYPVHNINVNKYKTVHIILIVTYKLLDDRSNT